MLYQKSNNCLVHIEEVPVKLVRVGRGAVIEEEVCEGGASGGGVVRRGDVACGFVKDDGVVERRHCGGVCWWIGGGGVRVKVVLGLAVE